MPRDPSTSRTITDVETFRALTHPTRLALIETLQLRGPLTATEAAEPVGESPSSCSFHLRQLARYGFVEEAEGGRGRRRPWKLTSLGMSWSAVQEDPATEVAAEALSRLLRDRKLDRHQTWLRSRGSYPAPWREAATDNQHLLWMTAEELHALSARLADEVGSLYRERMTDAAQRPAGAVPVELLVFGYPLAPPDGDA